MTSSPATRFGVPPWPPIGEPTFALGFTALVASLTFAGLSGQLLATAFLVFTWLFALAWLWRWKPEGRSKRLFHKALLATLVSALLVAVGGCELVLARRLRPEVHKAAPALVQQVTIKKVWATPDSPTEAGVLGVGVPPQATVYLAARLTGSADPILVSTATYAGAGKWIARISFDNTPCRNSANGEAVSDVTYMLSMWAFPAGHAPDIGATIDVGGSQERPYEVSCGSQWRRP
jgi:hypothetical protein